MTTQALEIGRFDGAPDARPPPIIHPARAAARSVSLKNRVAPLACRGNTVNGPEEQRRLDKGIGGQLDSKCQLGPLLIMINDPLNGQQFFLQAHFRH